MFLIVIPLLTFLIAVFSPKLQKAAEIDSKNEDSNRVRMQEILSRLPLFQVYSMEEVIDKNMNTLYKQKKASKIKLSLLEGSFGFLNSLMTFCIFIIASGVGAYFVIRGENQVGDLVAMIQLSNYIMLPITEAPKWFAAYNGTVTSMKRIQEVENMDEKEVFSTTENLGETIDSVVLNNLSFSFDDREMVLDNVNAIMERGRITGIIGESGSGKTTLLNLILGLYPLKNEAMVQMRIGERTVAFHGNRGNIAYVPSKILCFMER